MFKLISRPTLPRRNLTNVVKPLRYLSISATALSAGPPNSQAKKPNSGLLPQPAKGALFNQTKALATEAASTNSMPFSEMPHPPEVDGSSLHVFAGQPGSFSKLFQTSSMLHSQLGPIYKFKLVPGRPYWVSVADPTASSKIYRAEGEMPKRMPLKPFILYRQFRNLPDGVASTNDKESWKRWRLSFNELILKPQVARGFISRISPIAEDMVSRLNSLSTHSQDGSIEVDSEIFYYSLEAVSSVVFGKRMGCFGPDAAQPVSERAKLLVENVRKFFVSAQDLMNVPDGVDHTVLPAWKDHVDSSDHIFLETESYVREKLEEIKATRSSENDDLDSDVLSLMLGRPELTQVEAMIQAIEVLAAGIDTTTRALQWFLHHLALSGPDVQKKLRDEVVSLVGENGEISEAAVAKMKYMKACLKETFRLKPVAPGNQRIIEEDLELLGYHVPAGTVIQMATYTMSQDPKIFPNPDAFNPDRWMPPNVKETKAGDNSFATLPFGFGARMCPGRRLAELEVYTFMAALIRKFDIAYYQGARPAEPVLSLLMIPDAPMVMKFTPVKN